MNVIYEGKNGKSRLNQTPADYGCKDWHHNPDGSISYPCLTAFNKDGTPDIPEESISNRIKTDFTSIDIESQQYENEFQTEESEDAFSYERYRHAALCESFAEQERIEYEFN